MAKKHSGSSSTGTKSNRGKSANGSHKVTLNDNNTKLHDTKKAEVTKRVELPRNWNSMTSHQQRSYLKGQGVSYAQRNTYQALSKNQVKKLMGNSYYNARTGKLNKNYVSYDDPLSYLEDNPYYYDRDTVKRGKNSYGVKGTRTANQQAWDISHAIGDIAGKQDQSNADALGLPSNWEDWTVSQKQHWLVAGDRGLSDVAKAYAWNQVNNAIGGTKGDGQNSRYFNNDYEYMNGYDDDLLYNTGYNAYVTGAGHVKKSDVDWKAIKDAGYKVKGGRVTGYDAANTPMNKLLAQLPDPRVWKDMTDSERESWAKDKGLDINEIRGALLKRDYNSTTGGYNVLMGPDWTDPRGILNPNYKGPGSEGYSGKGYGDYGRTEPKAPGVGQSITGPYAGLYGYNDYSSTVRPSNDSQNGGDGDGDYDGSSGAYGAYNAYYGGDGGYDATGGYGDYGDYGTDDYTTTQDSQWDLIRRQYQSDMNDLYLSRMNYLGTVRDNTIADARNNYNGKANSAYITYRQNTAKRRTMASNLGMTGGGTENMRVGDENNYNNSLANINAGKNTAYTNARNAYSDAENNARVSRDNAIAGNQAELAQAEINYNQSQSQFERQQAAQRAQWETENNYNERALQYQQSQDAVNNYYRSQELKAQQNSDLATAMGVYNLTAGQLAKLGLDKNGKPLSNKNRNTGRGKGNK